MAVTTDPLKTGLADLLNPSFTSVTVSGLTAGRVVTTGTGGLLESPAELTWAGGTLGVTGNVGVTGTISAAGQVNASAFAMTGYLASTYSTKLLLAGESTDNFATFVVTNGAGRTYYMGPGVGDGALTTFALYDNNSGTTRWRSRASGFDVQGAISASTRFDLPSYTVATLPAAGAAGGLIFVTDETGGAVPTFSDGTDWRRVTDRAVVS